MLPERQPTGCAVAHLSVDAARDAERTAHRGRWDDTIAEGIAIKTAGMLTREIVRTYFDDFLLVEEVSIERAVVLLQ